DLYIDIPGYGTDRVNAAHAYGERDDAPEGGPGLLKQTLSEALGVPIHYWLRADFTGFKKAVDIVGGVEVNIEETVYDYAYPTPNGGYEIFQVDAGNKYMDGDTALKFARSRHTSSDFDRSKRQQQLLLALKKKALSLGTLANPIKLSSLISTIGDHMKMDLQINEIQKLMRIAGEVRDDQIARVGLDNSPENFLASANIGGAAVLVPKAGDFSEIRAYVRNLFVDGFIKSEAARVEVLNGSATAGLSTDTAQLLKSFGYQIERVGDADHSSYTQPVIYDYSNGSKPYTLRYLEKRFGTTAQRRDPAPGQEGMITIIVGGQYTPQT
ncbi:MAG TPA: LCP family protein, partial [Candidatus Babeliales bacterium]|nr:LCP family protein [Candidatus Babeliales bacterium]